MRYEIVMNVTETSAGILAEFTTENQRMAETIEKYINRRLGEMNMGDTAQCSERGVISIKVSDKQTLKELLNGKPLDFGALYPTAFAEHIRELYLDGEAGTEDELEIVFSEPQKPYIIRDNMKLSKFLLAVVFATCGVGVAAYGVTLFNLSILPAVFGKAAGLIVPIIGLTGFGIFCRFFNQPGGRR